MADRDDRMLLEMSRRIERNQREREKGRAGEVFKMHIDKRVRTMYIL
jgi:hypothetical protein